jgi:hypothetical protein
MGAGCELEVEGPVGVGPRPPAAIDLDGDPLDGPLAAGAEDDAVEGAGGSRVGAGVGGRIGVGWLLVRLVGGARLAGRGLRGDGPGGEQGEGGSEEGNEVAEGGGCKWCCGVLGSVGKVGRRR